MRVTSPEGRFAEGQSRLGELDFDIKRALAERLLVRDRIVAAEAELAELFEEEPPWQPTEEELRQMRERDRKRRW